MSSNSKKKKSPIYNPHWRGYFLLIVCSLVNVCAVGSAPLTNSNYVGQWGVCIAFPCVSLIFSLLVIILDRTQLGVEIFHFTTAWEGKLEGCFLLVHTMWWVGGVAYTTQAHGMAYLVLNIYFSSWLCLAASVFTLDSWSSKRDLLSLKELTGVSVTLKSWYILLVASLVVLGTAINLHLLQVFDKPFKLNSTDLFAATIFGGFSACASFVFILEHYRIFELVGHGGWGELVVCLALVMLWICGCGIFTIEGGIGATIVGRGCRQSTVRDILSAMADVDFDGDKSAELTPNGSTSAPQPICHVRVWRDGPGSSTENTVNVSLPCVSVGLFDDEREWDAVPGSNMFFAVWACLVASLNIALRWKAQQAVQFAAQAQQKRKIVNEDDVNSEDSEEDPEKDDGDLDDFVDVDQ